MFEKNQLDKESLRRIPVYLKDATEIEKIFDEKLKMTIYNFSKEIKGTKKILSLCFNNNKKKPSFYYSFESEEKRENFLLKHKTEALEILEKKEESKTLEKQRKVELSKKIAEGTILAGSWGYGQTNVEFYQVIEKVSKFKVKIRPILSKTVGEQGHDCDTVSPVKDAFTGNEDAILTRMITKNGIQSHEHCYLHVSDESREYHRSWYY